MDIYSLGWNPHFEQHFGPFEAEGLNPARVIVGHRDSYRVLCEQGELGAEVSGKFRFNAFERNEFPAVGDWVALSSPSGAERAIIHAILPRQSRFSRKLKGAQTEEQVVAANIDTVFAVMGLDGDFNPRRLERYLILARQGDVEPVIVLNKADLCDEVPERIADVKGVAPDAPVYSLCARDGLGLEVLRPWLEPGRTVALLGSSGVGKSTLINQLAGEERQRVRELKSRDGRGQHTTTHRELLFLPTGAMVIDTPGMKEVQLWADDESHEGTFSEIVELEQACRFRNCTHTTEPGCAVLEAIDRGTLDGERFDNYRKQQRELHYLHLRQDLNAARLERARWKRIAKAARDRARP